MKNLFIVFFTFVTACGSNDPVPEMPDVDIESDVIKVPQYESPYGEYYLRIMKVESCNHNYPHNFSPVGTQTDFILQIMYDLSNFYKRNPPDEDKISYLAKLVFGETTINEVSIYSNKKFSWAMPDSYSSLVMYGLRGQFSENWGTLVFDFSTYVSEVDLSLVCIDRWHGVASKIKDYKIPEFRKFEVIPQI